MLIIAFPLSFLISLAIVPVIRHLSIRYVILATPRVDRWHSKSTPKIGGVGIFCAFGISLVVIYFFSPNQTYNWALFAGSGLIFILGLVDDLKQISPPAKLIGQIIAAAIVVFFGRNIDFFADDFLNILVTFLWLVGITNAINLLDNMDGLAGGVSFISAVLLSILFWRSGKQDLIIVSLSLAGGLLGFLIFNFPPASIFMGDSGSLFLGFTLSALAIARVPQASNLLAVMGVPTLLFLLPILDTSLVTITRILRGQSPTQGGKDHTSHRLIAFGLSERQTVIVLYIVASSAGILGIIIESLNYAISLILIPLLLVTLALLTAYLGRLKVIPPGSTTPGQRSFASLMINLTYRGRILEIALDLFLISITYYLAFWIHFGASIENNLDIFINSLPIALAGSYISFLVFGIYRGVWQYLDIQDLLRYIKAALAAVLLSAGVMALIYNPLDISVGIFLIFTILLILGLVVTRSSFTILDRVYQEQMGHPNQEIPIVIFGANDSGIMLLRWLLQDNRHPMKPVGFLDDDPYKLGREILGISVIGQPNDIEAIAKSTIIEGILFSSEDSISKDRLNELKLTCDNLEIWLKTLRIEFDLIE
jgi:UDP-GlcNAc:undecaprenyl-phosphate GlcNAc-1-phosphate transferase